MNISAEGSSNTSIESIAMHVSTVSMDSLFTQPVLHAYTVRRLSRTNLTTDEYDMQAQLNARPSCSLQTTRKPIYIQCSLKRAITISASHYKDITASSSALPL